MEPPITQNDTNANRQRPTLTKKCDNASTLVDFSALIWHTPRSKGKRTMLPRVKSFGHYRQHTTFFLLLTSFALVFLTAFRVSAQQVKVMQWNVHGTIGNIASNNTAAAKALARIVNYNQPDILLFNELEDNGQSGTQAGVINWVTNNLSYLGSQPGVTFYVNISSTSDGYLRNGAVSRYQTLNDTTYGGGNYGPRGLHTFQVQLAGPNKLQVFQAHFRCCTSGSGANNDCTNRQNEAVNDAYIINLLMTNSPLPYIFAGDWNEDEDPRDAPECTITSYYHPITTVKQMGGLVEFEPTTLSGQWRTWSTKYSSPTIRFDYILAATNRLSPVSGYVFSTVDQANHGLYTNTSPQNLVTDSKTASDHFNVFANYFFPVDLNVTPTSGFSSTGVQGGPFSPSSQIYTLTNTGTVSANWNVTKTATWLDISASNGTLAAGASSNITVSVNSTANTLAPSTYTDTLNFTNPVSGVSVARGVSLTVLWPPPVADFTGSPTNGVEPVVVTFVDTSTGNISSRFWDFGDGGTTNVTTNSVAHTYSAGNYTVKLIATGPGGVSTNTKPNYITVLPSSTIAVEAANLQDASGNLAPTSTVVVLLADKGSNGFVDLQSNFSLNLGAIWGMDDQVVGLWDLRDSESCSGTNGALCAQTVVAYTNGIAPGQQLQLYWFPSLTVASNTLGITSYGKYTDTNSPPLDGSAPWQMPTGGTNVQVNFLTAFWGGSNPDAAGWATLLTTAGLTAFESWQIQYFGDTNNAAAASSADPDGDGQNNLAEFLAGTDPTNNAAVFRIVSATAEGSNVRLTWTMGSDRTNALQLSTGSVSGNYSNNFADVFTVTNTVGNVTNYLDLGAATNGSVRYYRVRLVP
jgi:PKD repeat protein/endonuclease/exonuclease/phosphatase family metal-dependent hydrolase